MKRYFPNWTANEVAESQVANQPVDDTAENSEYTDFVLSANWILRPAGLKEFYNRIRQAFEVRRKPKGFPSLSGGALTKLQNPEITYEIDIGCFRVRCRRDEQHALVTVCSEIMDELVKDEIKASPEEELLISIGVSFQRSRSGNVEAYNGRLAIAISFDTSRSGGPRRPIERNSRGMKLTHTRKTSPPFLSRVPGRYLRTRRLSVYGFSRCFSVTILRK